LRNAGDLGGITEMQEVIPCRIGGDEATCEIEAGK
jgi:hypothetical protein